jgi:hypothetical protein
MKSTELRIGNLLRDKVSKTELKVIELTENNIITKVIDRSKFPLKDGWGIEPIPLNEEWLLKFGFEEQVNDYYSKNEYKISFNDDLTKFYFLFFEIGDWYKELEHVHQLQNLYFALTNEELTLTK